MEFRSRSNQPQPAARPIQASPAARQNSEANDMDTPMNSPARPASFKADRSSKNKFMMIGIIIVAVIILLLAVSYLHGMFFSDNAAINSGEYQAVFLTNGQVYFGHLSNIDNSYATLTNIYYLQVQQQVQPSSGSNSSSSQQPQVSLTKLGNELHGPEDFMYIAKPQILFWENLKNDGKVVQAIKQSLNH